jgi:hypothetical protein
MNQGMIVQKIPVSEINPAKYNPRKDLKPGDPVPKTYIRYWMIAVPSLSI